MYECKYPVGFIREAWKGERGGTDPIWVSKSASMAGPGQLLCSRGFGSLFKDTSVTSAWPCGENKFFFKTYLALGVFALRFSGSTNIYWAPVLTAEKSVMAETTRGSWFGGACSPREASPHFTEGKTEASVPLGTRPHSEVRGGEGLRIQVYPG